MLAACRRARILSRGSAAQEYECFVVELEQDGFLQFVSRESRPCWPRSFEQETNNMADRNRSDLDREQRGSSNPNQTERPEDRSTSSSETGMGGSNTNQNQGRNQG